MRIRSTAARQSDTIHVQSRIFVAQFFHRGRLGVRGLTRAENQTRIRAGSTNSPPRFPHKIQCVLCFAPRYVVDLPDRLWLNLASRFRHDWRCFWGWVGWELLPTAVRSRRVRSSGFENRTMSARLLHVFYCTSFFRWPASPNVFRKLFWGRGDSDA